MHSHFGSENVVFWTMFAVAEGAGLVLLVLWLVSKRRGSQSNASLGLNVRRMYGRRTEVKVIDRPGIEFVDVEKVPLSIAPKDADGRVVAGAFAWEVIEQVPAAGQEGDVLLLSVDESNLSAWAISGVPGTCVVTVTDVEADVMERMPVTIKFGEPAELNLSAGAPVPEVTP